MAGLALSRRSAARIPCVVATGLHAASLAQIAARVSCYARRLLLRERARPGIARGHEWLLPGLSRIQLDQHWASDIFAGAFMGIFAGYKVTKYSHDNPNNWFDRKLLKMTVSQAPDGRMMVGFSAF